MTTDFKPKIILPGGQSMDVETKIEVDTAVVLYLQPNGGPTLFDINVKFQGVKVTRLATVEDIYRMCNEVANDVNNMKQSQGLEKVLDLREQIKAGKIKFVDGKLVPGPNADGQVH